ncbi:MAG: ATP-binding protein [Acidobacteriota bacterium]
MKRSLQAFERRVGLFLLLVLGYLVTLQTMHALSKRRSHQLLVADNERRARLTARMVLRESDPDRLRRELSRSSTPRALLSTPASYLRARGLSFALLLGTDGEPLRGRELPQGLETVERFDDDTLERLRSGRTVVDSTSLMSADLSNTEVLALTPILVGSGELLAVLAVGVEAENLARSSRALRWNSLIEIFSLVTFVAIVAWFAGFSLKPVRLLAQTASSRDPQTTAELEAQDDTGFVIETYRKMVDELRGKERELRRLKDLERHRADELQDLNTSIIDSMITGVLLLDGSGRVRALNDVARDALQVTGRAIGRPAEDVFAAYPELLSILSRCLKEGATFQREPQVLNLPGIGRRDLELTLSPMADRDGNPIGASCLLVDVTEIRRLEERMRLQQNMAELGEISGGIAHEFRNSLGTLLGNARLIEKQGEGPVVEHAEEISAEVQALRLVIDDFLRFANPTRLVIERVDLAALLEELRPDVLTRAADKTVELELPDSVPEIGGDEGLLRRVFTNLLRNAADVIDDGGRIAVVSEASPGELLLHVDDDGPGISEGDEERVFIPFFTRKDRGTGLGLALARKVVVHHGGRITAGASPLGGARFTVALPLKDDEEGGEGE